jgi:hypothetical protein
MRPAFDPSNPALTFPFVSEATRAFIVPIYPDYHTSLLPDSILRTESPADFIEQYPHRNAIRKVYICRSIYRDLHRGDAIVFYRTGGYYKSVVTPVWPGLQAMLDKSKILKKSYEPLLANSVLKDRHVNLFHVLAQCVIKDNFQEPLAELEAIDLHFKCANLQAAFRQEAAFDIAVIFFWSFNLEI